MGLQVCQLRHLQSVNHVGIGSTLAVLRFLHQVAHHVHSRTFYPETPAVVRLCQGLQSGIGIWSAYHARKAGAFLKMI